MEPSDHLFRHEAGRMVATLTRIFGVHNLALAEDVVQDAFCRALEVWKFRGVPENPSAWLMTTAKNRALDVLRRERTARTFAPELGRLLESEWTLAPAVEEFFSSKEIQDDQLRMMFSCCPPRLPEEAQVALMLHILCGFSVDEVAAAFVSTHAAIEKRITRAKKILASSKRLFDIADAARLRRAPSRRSSRALPAFQRRLPRRVVRIGRARGTLPGSHAPHGPAPGASPGRNARDLRALRAHVLSTRRACPARLDSSGDLRALLDQDRSRWDARLAEEGENLLALSATGTELTEYHLEASIAWVHAAAPSAEETNWEMIVELYDRLLALRPSPVVALNRAIAIAQREGPQRGIEEIRAIANADRLAAYPFYHAALGEFEFRSGRPEIAAEHFRAALACARNPMERRFLQQRVTACAPDTPPANANTPASPRRPAAR